MSADLLRKAAQVLRERAEAGADVVEITNGRDTTTAYRRGGDYFLDLAGGQPQATRRGITVTREFHEWMQPSVGLALADWLDAMAAVWIGGGRHVFGNSAETAPPTSLTGRALTVARLILGEA